MDAVVEEKQRAFLCYRLRRAVLLFRCLFESLAALALLSWSSERLPTALAHGADIFSRLPAVVLHPLSAFVLCNAIVVTLVAKSGAAARAADDQPSSPYTAAKAAALDVACDPDGCCFYPASAVAPPPPQVQQKAVEEELATDPTGQGKGRYSESELREDQCTGKSEEEEEEEEQEENGLGGLTVAMDDGVEFRQKIETFIMKQLRFIEREEEALLVAEVSEHKHWRLKKHIKQFVPFS